MVSSTYMHLGIDYQTILLNSLTQEHRDSFVACGRELAANLRALGVKTTWVVYSPYPEDTHAYYPASLWESEPERMGTLLHKVYGVPDELVVGNPALFMKTKDNTFCPQRPSAHNLDRILKDQGVKTIILSGNKTSLCISATAIGAVKAGFNCIVAYDAITNTSADFVTDPRTNQGTVDSEKQKDLLLKKISGHEDQIKLMTRLEIYRMIKHLAI